MSQQKYRTETNCLNCGAEVKGKFCSECGQENLELHENFFHMVTHVIGDFFHFDSKFFRSVIPLFTKPGFLTKQYIEGKRVNYIHPLRLLFFVIIVAVIAANAYYKKYEKDIADNQTTVIDDQGNKEKLSEARKKQIELSEEEKKGIASAKLGFKNMFEQLKYISFFLLPLYALGFKLLYSRKKLYYMDHLIYTMHVQSFIYIILTLVWLLAIAFPVTRNWFDNAVILFLLIYMILSLRYLYQQPWWKTILKSILAMFYITIVTSVVLAVVVILTFLINN